MEIDNFWGNPTDISARKDALVAEAPSIMNRNALVGVQLPKQVAMK